MCFCVLTFVLWVLVFIVGEVMPLGFGFGISRLCVCEGVCGVVMLVFGFLFVWVGEVDLDGCRCLVWVWVGFVLGVILWCLR